MLGTHSEPCRGQMSHICDISALRVKHPKLPVSHRQLRAGGNLERQTRTISQSSPLDGLIRLRDRCLPQEKNALRGPQKPNTSILTAKTSLYTIGAGITTIAVPDLPSNFFSLRSLDCTNSNCQTTIVAGVVIYCHYLPDLGLGNLHACCLYWMW